MRSAFLPLALLALSVFGVSTASAKTLYVSHSGDSSTGESWETAFNSITAALVASVTNDEIRVTAESYSDNIDVATPLTILGGFEPVKANTSLMPTGLTTLVAAGEGPVIELLADAEIHHFLVSGGFGTSGSGLYAFKSECSVVGCILKDNNADYLGGGVNCYKASVSIQDSKISHNSALQLGGGIVCDQGRVTLKSSFIFDNQCLGSPGDPEVGVLPQPGVGGGLYVSMSHVDISNCLFVENDAEVGSDLYYGGVGSLRCTNCTFGSTTFPNVRIGSLATGSMHIFNSILWGDDISFQGPQGVISYSNVRGGFPGVGNTNQDPLFVNLSGGDFHLQEGSPCIDSASTTGPASDLDGNPRPYDVPEAGRNGSGDEFDMGAYEFTFLPTPAPTLVNERSDIDGSDRVDAVDLLILLGDWMKTTGPLPR